MEAALLDTARAGRRGRLRPAHRALPRPAARALLPDARLGPRRRGRAAGGVAARVARRSTASRAAARCKSWLYTIATNTCLNQIERRPKRVLPVDYAAAGRPARRAGRSRSWSRSGSSPIPTSHGPRRRLRRRPTRATRSARASSSPSSPPSSTCPPMQRAGAAPCARCSATRRARSPRCSRSSVAGGQQRAPARPRRGRVQSSTRAHPAGEPARAGRREGAGRSSSATWTRCSAGDVPAVVSMLQEEAACSMPPLTSWFRGTEDLEGGVPAQRPSALRASYDWRHLPAFGQRPGRGGDLQCACPTRQRYMAFSLDVLTLDGGADPRGSLLSLIIRSTASQDAESYPHWPDERVDPARRTRCSVASGCPTG